MCKVVSLLISLLMCFALSMTASAQTIPASVQTNRASSVQPFYEEAKSAKSELYINGATAMCKSNVTGNSDVVKITATQYLQKQGFLWIWTTYDAAEWTKTVYTNSLSMSNTKTGLTSGKYRLKTDFTLTDKNGKTETISVYSDERSV